VTIATVGAIGNIVRRNIRRLRQTQRLTYVDLSKRLASAGRPIAILGLRRIEAGERRVDTDDLVALASVLGVTATQLLEPPTDCAACHGTPPPGFACRSCGAEA
jgi:transcriptional regulator with XRE-family HTH domain